MRGIRRPFLPHARRFEGRTTPNPNPYSSPSPILTLTQPAPICRGCPVFYQWQLIRKEVNQHTADINALKSRLGILEDDASPTVRKKVESVVKSKVESNVLDALLNNWESILMAIFAFFGWELFLRGLLEVAKDFISELKKKSMEEFANLIGQLKELMNQADEMPKKGKDN